MKKVKVIVECGKDGKYSAFMDCYDFDFSLAGFGSTAKASIADFYDCVTEEKIMREKEGKTMPELEFDIQYDVSSFLSYYSDILSKSGLEKVTGINQKQLWHYSSGKRKPTKQTTLRIQDGLHRLAANLREVSFVYR
ncbi:MAG: DNA-binding protein [Lentimicrobiaceae bacterium]|nr:DNA-binding protein [Lentimicrobiaceae bacterium]